MDPVSLLVSGLVMAGISVAKGIAGNVSAKRNAEAQYKVDVEQDKFNKETEDMNMATRAEDLSFKRNMFGQQQKRDKQVLNMKNQDLKEQSARMEGQRKDAVLSQNLSSPVASQQRAQKNILNLTGGR